MREREVWAVQEDGRRNLSTVNNPPPKKKKKKKMMRNPNFFPAELWVWMTLFGGGFSSDFGLLYGKSQA